MHFVITDGTYYLIARRRAQKTKSRYEFTNDLDRASVYTENRAALCMISHLQTIAFNGAFNGPLNGCAVRIKNLRVDPVRVFEVQETDAFQERINDLEQKLAAALQTDHSDLRDRVSALEIRVGELESSHNRKLDALIDEVEREMTTGMEQENEDPDAPVFKPGKPIKPIES